MTGEPGVDVAYRQERIRIALNPFAERFEVTSAALEKIPKGSQHLGGLHQPAQGPKAFRERYAVTHELTEETDEWIEEVFAKLHGLKDFSFTVVELQPTVDREKVAEIFVHVKFGGSEPYPRPIHTHLAECLLG